MSRKLNYKKIMGFALSMKATAAQLFFALLVFMSSEAFAQGKCSEIFKTETHSPKYDYDSLKDFEFNDPQTKKNYFSDINDMGVFFSAEHSKFWPNISRYFPKKDYFKYLTIDRWGMHTEIQYEALKQKIKLQPFVYLSPTGKVKLYAKGAAKKFLQLLFPQKKGMVFRGEDRSMSVAHKMLFRFYHGHSFTELKADFLEAVRFEAHIKIEQAQMHHEKPEAERELLTAQQAAEQLNDADFANYLLERYFIRDYLFYSASHEGASVFAQHYVYRNTSTYRFHKDSFLKKVGTKYSQYIHVGAEQANARVNHFEIGFPMRESREDIIELIKSLEPLDP